MQIRSLGRGAHPISECEEAHNHEEHYACTLQPSHIRYHAEDAACCRNCQQAQQDYSA